jgi:cation transport regulator ChaB
MITSKNILMALVATGVTGAQAQFLDCSPEAVLKSGVRGIYSDESLAQLIVFQRHLPPGAAVNTNVNATFAREHKNCVRLRRDKTEQSIFENVEKYKQQQLNRSFGAWAINAGIGGLTSGGVGILATEIGGAWKALDKTLEYAGKGADFLGIDIGEKIIDSQLDAPAAYINRIASIAFAEAKVAGTAITPENVSRRLEDLLRADDSPIKNDEDAIDAIRNTVHHKFREMMANAPNTDVEKWFSDSMTTALGFNPNTTVQGYDKFSKSNRKLSANQKYQAERIRKAAAEIRKSREDALKNATSLLQQAADTSQLALNTVPESIELEKLGQKIISDLDPATVANPTLLKSTLVNMSQNCISAALCAAFQQQIKNATFREKAKDFAENAVKAHDLAVTAVKALSLLGGDPEQVRFLSAVATSASSAATIAKRIASASTLGPMGWVAIAGDLMDLGGTLGGMFGGSSVNPDVQMHSRVMEALASISRQIEDLRKEIRSQFAENRRQLELLEMYSKISTDLMISVTEYAGLKQCLDLAKGTRSFMAHRGVPEPEYILSGPDDAKLLAAQCHEWFINEPNGGFAISNHGLSVLFASQSQNIKAQVQGYSSGVARDAFLDQINQEQDGLSRLKRLSSYSLSWHAGNSKSPSDLGALVYSPAHMLELERVFNSLKGQPSNTPKPLDFPALMIGLGGESSGEYTPQSVSDVGSFDSMLSKRLDSELATNVLEAGLLIRQMQPYMEPYRNGNVISVKISDPETDESFMVRATPYWMWKASVLANLLKVQLTLYRGDYAVPLIDLLLRDPKAAERCVAAPPVATGVSICERFGQDVLTQLLEDARVVIAMFPELRANVAAWRTRQALKSDKPNKPSTWVGFDETGAGIGFQPLYGQALDQNSPLKLQVLMPNEVIYLMNTDYAGNEGYSMYAQDTERSSRWFIKLAGSCAGLDRAAYNARSTCKHGKCEGVEISKNAFGNWLLNVKPESFNILMPTDPATTTDVLNKWRTDLESNCVVAPLPSRQMLEWGSFWSPLNHESALNTANRFLIAASREINRHIALVKLTDTPDKLTTDVRNELLGSIFFTLKPATASGTTGQ